MEIFTKQLKNYSTVHGVSSAFPQGKQHGEKTTIIGNDRELYLDQCL